MTFIKVKARPGAKEESIEKISDSEYKISVRGRAEHGKANERIISLLSRELKIHHKNIMIKNPSSRNKIVKVILD